MIQLMVMYPQPTDVEQFDKDYTEHIALLHEKMGIPESVKPYKIIKFSPSPAGPAPYYQTFMLPFENMETLQATLASQAMQEVAMDANRISSGGLPVILVGNEA